ncbi:MAG: YvrJ family protein [Clostridia bacterium]|nr:MAG: YvrJ family protein [Clostridia bacterium]
MDTLWAQIGNWGFPMVVAVYLLVRIEKKLDDLTLAIGNLGQALALRTGTARAQDTPGPLS